MFNTLETLILGANTRAEKTLLDTYGIELIDQKIHGADEGPRAAKGILRGINRELSHDGLADRMAHAGFGPNTSPK